MSGACPIATSRALPGRPVSGTISRTAMSTVCRELRLRVLMADAIYLPVRPKGPKEGVFVA
jgi:hypothetical protein